MNTIHAWELEAALLPGALHENERATARRDAASFDLMVTREQAYVTRLVGRLAGWRSDVDDLVQDVFVAALGGWAKFRGDCSERTWLTRIALNKCRSFGRRRWLRERFLTAWNDCHELVAAGDAGQERCDVAEQVRRAVEQLRPADREVIVLHYLEQLSAADVASLLQVRRNAVEVRLNRARQRLKGILEREQL
jgi:RNA polymerase sigma-70 factor (ECF subfamily)